jgi:hypothetical protein
LAARDQRQRRNQPEVRNASLLCDNALLFIHAEKNKEDQVLLLIKPTL